MSSGGEEQRECWHQLSLCWWSPLSSSSLCLVCFLSSISFVPPSITPSFTHMSHHLFTPHPHLFVLTSCTSTHTSPPHKHTSPLLPVVISLTVQPSSLTLWMECRSVHWTGGRNHLIEMLYTSMYICSATAAAVEHFLVSVLDVWLWSASQADLQTQCFDFTFLWQWVTHLSQTNPADLARQIFSLFHRMKATVFISKIFSKNLLVYISLVWRLGAIITSSLLCTFTSCLVTWLLCKPFTIHALASGGLKSALASKQSLDTAAMALTLACSSHDVFCWPCTPLNQGWAIHFSKGPHEKPEKYQIK